MVLVPLVARWPDVAPALVEKARATRLGTLLDS
jgi:hypothetical protein